MKFSRAALLLILMMACLLQPGWAQQVHSDTKNGFSIRYPRGWSVVSRAIGLLYVKKHYSWIRVDSVTAEANGREHFTKRRAKLESAAGFKTKMVTVGGAPTEALLTQSSSGATRLEMLVVRHGRAFFIEGSYPDFIPAEQEREFYSVLGTFQVTPGSAEKDDF